MRQQTTEAFYDAIPYIMDGQVVATNDPDQMGRVRVWVPALDGQTFDIEQLPWADYASPFMGFTVNYPGGNGSSNNQSQVPYGFWAIPKIGSTVLVFCLNADPTCRCYFAATVGLHRNRSFPAGRNTDANGNVGPFGDDVDENGTASPIQPAYNNLRVQFQNKMTASETVTRGGYERQAAQAKDDKDGSEGYSKNPADTTYLDPQTYCLVTPGRHAMIMQDDPSHSRLRLKTAEGHQIIFDDANERIYMSTCHGRSWVELDRDGHVHVFGADSVSIHSGKDLNLSADGNVNIEAKNSINIKSDDGGIKMSATGSIQIQSSQDIIQSACGIFDIDSEQSIHITSADDTHFLAGGGTYLTGTGSIDVLSGGGITITGEPINLNGPAATPAVESSCSEQADSVSVMPQFEPWTRPVTSLTGGRNPNWNA